MKKRHAQNKKELVSFFGIPATTIRAAPTDCKVCELSKIFDYKVHRLPLFARPVSGLRLGSWVITVMTGSEVLPGLWVALADLHCLFAFGFGT